MINKAESKLSVKETLKMMWYRDAIVELQSYIEKEPGAHCHGTRELIRGRAWSMLQEGTPVDDYPVIAFCPTVDGNGTVICYCQN